MKYFKILRMYFIYFWLLGLEENNFLKIMLFDCKKNIIMIVIRLEKLNLFELIVNMFCSKFNKNWMGFKSMGFFIKYFFIVLLRFMILGLIINFIYVFLLLVI